MPLRYVDPHKKRGRWYAALDNFGRSRAGQETEPIGCHIPVFRLKPR